MKTDNHFITVSRDGRLLARRKGCPPVVVAHTTGLPVTVDAQARDAGAPDTVLVRFRHGGGNRELRVTEIVAGDQLLDVGVFQAQFAVSDERLGRWIRATVEEALDRAAALPR